MKKILKYLITINYWEKQANFKLGLIRHTYLHAIEKSLGNKLIKVIVGQRRSGKSYLVRQLMDLLIQTKNVNPKNIFYLNKESYEFDSIAQASDLAQLIRLYEETYNPAGKIYIIIDEIQNISEWEKIIVSMAQDPVKEYEVIITGSNSTLLSGELASLLSGRYLLTEVLPYTYKEFLDFYSYENTKENFIIYMEKGGLPEIHNIESTEVQKNYCQSLKDTVLLKDIMLRHKIRDQVLLNDLFLFIVHNVGNLTSVTSIIKYFKSKNRKADYSTISNYIAFMEDAYLLHQAQRFSLKNKELLSGEKKYFLNDIGFRNFLYPTLVKDVGAALENIVYLHLRHSGFEVKLGFERNFEIDFYATKENSINYIQVAYLLAGEETVKREFGALEKIKDHFPKYVLSMDDLKFDSSSGIYHEKIWDYIYNLN